MIKDIENKFFQLFEPFGLLDSCFEWLSDEYDLGVKFDKNDKGKPKEAWHSTQIEYHDKLIQVIEKKAKQLDDTVLSWGYHITESPLMVEISNNLDECKGDEKQTEQYIYDLLTPFKRYSDIWHPMGVIEYYKQEIKREKKCLETWEGCTDEQMKGKQIEAIKHTIERLQFQMERAIYVANRYREILNEFDPEKKVENYCSDCLQLIERYSLSLDVLLLKRGINLMYYQRESGIYLFEHRNITHVEDFCGSRKLAQKYIDEAQPPTTDITPRKPEIEKRESEGAIIPPSNSLTDDEQEAVFTERALKYFERAIDEGYMELTPSHYKWLYGGKHGKVRCGVFLLRVYCPNNTEQLPEQALHKLFDMERLDSAITGFQGTKKKQRWLPNIDKMFDD